MKHTLLVEYFFDDHYKFYIAIIGIAISSFAYNQIDWNSIIVGMAYLIILVLGLLGTLIVFLIKRGFTVENGLISHCLFVLKKPIVEKKIKTLDYNRIEIETLNKADVSMLYETSMINLFLNHNEFSIFLWNDNTSKKELLVSISTKEKTSELIYFLRRYSGLKFEQYELLE